MRVTLTSAVVLLLTIGLIQGAPVSAQSSGTLTGTVYDPLGAPAEGMVVSIENGLFGAGISEQMPTDKTGKYRFEKLPPGVYTITLPIESAPSFEVSLGEGQLVRQDIRMHIEEVIGTFSVCVDCDPSPRYVPPDSLVREFASDRDAAANQSVRSAEPTVGWEYYEPDVRVTESIRERGLTGTVVLEARVEANGTVTNVSVASSPHAELGAAAAAALQSERWNAATVRGVSVAAPLRLTIEFVRRAKPE